MYPKHDLHTHTNTPQPISRFPITMQHRNAHALVYHEARLEERTPEVERVRRAGRG